MLDATLFGPIQVADKPDFNLHDLCILWTQAADDDLDCMVEITRKLGGVWNEPGIIWDGLLLDGRNRQIVCKQLGLPYEYREFYGNYEQARAYVMAKNLARRHLTREQKAMFAVMAAKIDEKYGYGHGPDVKAISRAHNVQPDTVRKAIAIANIAEDEIEDGQSLRDDPRINKILTGESSVSKQMQEIKDQGKKLNLTGEKRKPGQQPYDPSDDCYLDDNGVPVNGQMIDIWRSLSQFNTVKQFAVRLNDDLKKLLNHPAASMLSVEHVRHLSDLIRDLDAKQPSYICPHCMGKHKCDCPLCKTRWLGRGIDDRLDCYCCHGVGYLVKEQPYPDKEWHSR